MAINYPNGKPAVKKSEAQISHMRKNLGMQFEKDVILSCDYYRDMKLALIYKRPTPIKVCKMDKKNRARIVEAYFDEKSTTDFNGIYRKTYVDFECKETICNTLSLTKIRSQQIAHLRMVKQLGGIAFFLVHFKTVDECYLLDCSYIVDDLTKKSFSRDFFKEHGRLVKPGFQPRYELLKAMDEEYFNEGIQED